MKVYKKMLIIVAAPVSFFLISKIPLFVFATRITSNKWLQHMFNYFMFIK